MDERDLRIFLNLSGFDSIREAGRNLYMTQPSLSLHIKKLEKEVGAELIRRNRSGFELTTAGKQLLGFAPIFIALCEEIRQRTAVQEVQGNTWTIGATSSLSIFLLGPVLGHWALKRSQHNLKVAVGRHRTIINDVLNGRICMGLVRTLPRDVIGIKRVRLGDERILGIESATNSKATSIAALNDKTFFCPAPDNVLWEAVDSFLKHHGIVPRKIVHVATAEARIQAVIESTDTVAFAPESTINFRGYDTSSIRVIKTPDMDVIPKSPVYVIWREDVLPQELSSLVSALKRKFNDRSRRAS